MLTSADVRARVNLEAQQRGGYAELARHLGFAPSYVGRVAAGEIEPSKRFAAALGYRKVTRYELAS